ncbi:MAG: undecaprenyl-diphosphate phosphatase [Ktedonobacteraceae bacterium]|nr:undecaprenyl-diphosphate phosphatase [Ktedonobacteraceae bacterium]
MNLDPIKTLFLALLQGVTELFPISSLGHTVILPPLFGWGDLEHDRHFLPLIVALHLGTAIALILYFWRDWWKFLLTFINIARTRRVSQGTEEWVSVMVVVGTIPAGLLGLILQKPLEKLFSSPLITAAFLVVNGSMLFLAEGLRRRAEARLNGAHPKEREAFFRPLASLSWKEAVIVGLAQALALIPGFSRSGASLAGGLMVRLTHEDAARFSFLLGTPIILAAAVLKVPELFHLDSSTLLLVFLGMVLAGVAAFLSTHFLMRYFEKGRLDPFAYYCWGGGLVYLILLLIVVRPA